MSVATHEHGIVDDHDVVSRKAGLDQVGDDLLVLVLLDATTDEGNTSQQRHGKLTHGGFLFGGLRGFERCRLG